MGLGKGHYSGGAYGGTFIYLCTPDICCFETDGIFVERTISCADSFLPEQITFIHAEELRKRYPEATPKQREQAITKEYGAVFICGIGGALSDGTIHDDRSPDYDDWSTLENGLPGLNGDILVWNPVLQSAFEISSMGIRVNPEALERQLEIRGCEERKNCFSFFIVGGKFAPDNGRRDRAIPLVHVVVAEMPYRRSAGRLVAG